MKFIRDIIGAKRQAGADSTVSVPGGGPSYPCDAPAAKMGALVAEPKTTIAEAHFDTSEDPGKVTDEIAAFFAKAEADRFGTASELIDAPGTASQNVAADIAAQEEAVMQDPAPKQVTPEPAVQGMPLPEEQVAVFGHAGLADANAYDASENSGLATPGPSNAGATGEKPEAGEVDEPMEVEDATDNINDDITAALVNVFVPDHDEDPQIEKTLRSARRMTKPSDAAEPQTRFGGEAHQSKAAPADNPAHAPSSKAFILSQEFRELDEPALRAERPADPAPAPAPAATSAPKAEAKPGETTPSETAPAIAVPQPAMGRGAARQERVKTRLLGFDTSLDTGLNPMARQQQAAAAPFTSFPVGWLIVVDGPGRGAAFTLFKGVSTIGRGEDQIVRLDFGDNSISRENHASVAYDPVGKACFIGHGGKANLLRRNNRPVLSTEELSSGDLITIGETVLRFVPLCGPEFSWDSAAQGG